jgi:TonB family protein
VTKPLSFLLGVAIAVGSISCGRERHTQKPPLELPVQVLADSGEVERLRVDPPSARVWMASVAPARLPPSTPPLPDAAPDSVAPEPAPPPLEIDQRLKPPILRSQPVLVLPPGARLAPGSATVELDVHVDEGGEVSRVQWVGGSPDTALVRAAERCARSMRFYPALQGDRPVAVWCRQRFDFAARRADR